MIYFHIFLNIYILYNLIHYRIKKMTEDSPSRRPPKHTNPGPGNYEVKSLFGGGPKSTFSGRTETFNINKQ